MTQAHDSERPKPDEEPWAELPVYRPNPRYPSTRRRRLPFFLFCVSCLSICFAGICRWYPPDLLEWLGVSGGLAFDPTESFAMRLRMAVLRHGGDAVIYTVCLLAILVTHEMGHFLMSVRYRVPASFPYFLPLPISPIGTLGAVIAMDGRQADRREIFDIGLAGPIAGLFVAIPILWHGVQLLDLSQPGSGPYTLDLPLAVRWMVAAAGVSPNGPPLGVAQSQLNPYFMAGWVGLLVTGLNMLPVSQLDGGHVIHGLFGRSARWIARCFMAVAIGYVIYSQNYTWLVMLGLILLMGTAHPPTRNDDVRLDPFRTALGVIALAIPILCFPPRVFRDL